MTWPHTAMIFCCGNNMTLEPFSSPIFFSSAVSLPRVPFSKGVFFYLTSLALMFWPFSEGAILMQHKKTMPLCALQSNSGNARIPQPQGVSEVEQQGVSIVQVLQLTCMPINDVQKLLWFRLFIVTTLLQFASTWPILWAVAMITEYDYRKSVGQLFFGICQVCMDGSRSNIFPPWSVMCSPWCFKFKVATRKWERCHPNTQCVQLTWNKRIAMWFAVAESSCFLLYGLLALWTRPIGSSMSGTLVGTLGDVACWKN